MAIRVEARAAAAAPETILDIIGDGKFMHMLEHDPIRIDDNIGEYLLPEKDARHTSGHSRQKRIAHILARYGMPLVPECFKCTDERPLLFYHAGHSRQADQRCHKKEDHREYFSDSAHPVCIFTITGVIRKIVSVIYIPLRFFQVPNLFLSVCKFLLCVFDLLFAVRKLRFCFCLTLIIFCPSVCNLLLAGCNLCLCVSELLFSIFQLCPAAVDLFLRRSKLCFRCFNLRLSLGSGCLPRSGSARTAPGALP